MISLMSIPRKVKLAVVRHSLPCSALAALLLAGEPASFAQSNGAGKGDAPATQPAEKLPSADEVMDDFIKATGGKDAYDKLKNRVTKGVMSIPAQGIKGPITMYQAAPDKMYTSMELAGVGVIEQGVLDGMAWEKNDMQGARLLEGEELATMLRNASFNSELKWHELYKSVECTAKEMVDGKPAYKVVCTPEQGKPISHFFDAESHLLIFTKMIISTSMGDIPVESVLSDYRDMGGIKMATKTVQKMMMQELVMQMESVEHNVELPADRFEPPAEVKALMEKAKAGKTPDKTPGKTPGTQPAATQPAAPKAGS